MIRATDLYMTRALQIMLQDLRKNRFLIEDMLSDVTQDPLLKGLYGQKEVDKFNLLVDKEIQINLEYAIDIAKLPAIAVRVGGGTEDTSRTGDALSDGFSTEKVDAKSLKGIYTSPRIVLGPVTPISFDSVTGKIVFPDDVKLTRVFDGMKVFDEVNQKEYDIVLVADDSTIFIKPNQKPNLNGMTIRSREDVAVHVRREFFTTESVTLVCCATDPVEVIYLYQIVMYMIGRHRLSLFEGKNFRTTVVQYSPIYRLTEDPNFIFARDITITGNVLHSYIESTSRPIDGGLTVVKIADADKTPSGLTTIVDAQGWKPEKDE